ncbi:hypothetical protein LINPERHAP1_LOCUS12556 [Linum perenne]
MKVEIEATMKKSMEMRMHIMMKMREIKKDEEDEELDFNVDPKDLMYDLVSGDCEL